MSESSGRRSFLDPLKAWFEVPEATRFLEILGFSLSSGMDLSSAVQVARTHVERLDEHHKVNMLESALERGENLVEALLEANLVRIEQFEELKLAEKSGFLPQTLAKMGQRKGPSIWFKSVHLSGGVMAGFYVVFLAGGITYVLMSMF